MKILSILLLVLLSISSSASYDLSTGAGFRTYPLGAAVKVESGLNQELWRHDKQIYGFVREAAYFSTSGSINTLGAKIDIFPVSILGIVGGVEKVFRNSKELDTFDCDVQVCDSNGSKSYLKFENVLAYKNLILINDYQREFFKYDHDGEVANALHTMEIDSEDIVNILRNIIAYQLKTNYKVGFLHIRSWSEISRQDTTFVGVLNQITRGKWTYDGILGSYHGRSNSDHLSVMFQIKYDFKKGLRLF